MELLLVIAVIGAYFLPTAIAVSGRRENAMSVFALNLLLGWSGIGWIASLFLALRKER